MLESSVAAILSHLNDSDLVLDVGAWASPFNRAQWVLDAQPYDTRGFYRTFGGAPFQGPEREWFTRETWVQRDICDREPWPFRDRFFDFAICSHTLEDLRDPLGVCSELVRVAKAGYIEVPSRVMESSRGLERRWMAGLSHHRWLIELQGDSHLVFMHKSAMIHERYLSLPKRYHDGLPEEQRFLRFLWEGGFTFEEREIHGLAEKEAELEAFAQGLCPRPLGARLDRGIDAAAALPRRATGWLRRRLHRG